MPKSPYVQRRPGTLKAAVTDLIERCGGFARAAELARVSRSQLFRYSDDCEENAATNMPADIVAALERYCGHPIVTEWLAAEASCTLLAIQVGPVDDETIPKDVAGIAANTSTLCSEFALAFADGKIDAAEAGKMLRAGDAMVREYMHLRPALTDLARG